MPELPEVETIKNDLKKRILRKKITAVEIRSKKIVHPVRNLSLNGVKNKPADFIPEAVLLSGTDRYIPPLRRIETSKTIGRKAKPLLLKKTFKNSKRFLGAAGCEDAAGVSQRNFTKILKGSYFSGLDRIGKLLIFELADKKNFLLIHLKMTGQLIYCGKGRIVAGGHSLTPSNSPLVRGRINPLLLSLVKGENLSSPLQGEVPPPRRGRRGEVGGGAPVAAGAEGWVGGGVDKLPGKHTRIIFSFKDKARLFFNDLRKFGYAKIVGKKELAKIKEKYGPEPLTKEFTLAAFRKALEGRNASVKAILLNQGLIAGIGNIYADEALFEARIRPSRQGRSLSGKEEEALFKAINNIIKKAIKYRGTTFSSYVDAAGRKGNFTRLLKVYHQEGQKCKRCGAVIKKARIAGRGTRYCDKCQK